MITNGQPEEVKEEVKEEEDKERNVVEQSELLRNWFTVRSTAGEIRFGRAAAVGEEEEEELEGNHCGASSRRVADNEAIKDEDEVLPSEESW